jgi:Putative peptidoglycan binding domain/LysM domain
MACTHIVKPGDCLSSLADAYGLSSWHVIYDAPENADFRSKRDNPNLINPGDEIYIPDPAPRAVNVPVDRRHIFRVEFPPTWLNVRVQDTEDDPVANASFELEIEKELTLKGTTDGDGWIRVRIPAWAEDGLLRVWPDQQDPEIVIEWQTRLGHLDPIDTITGIKGRLRNLGYECGELNDTEDEAYISSVMQFQSDCKLKMDGIPGPKTKDALLRLNRT